ncbi:sel1 repeat family protein [Nitrosomonas sp. JL21]|uniref:tetratricopeptide repeat protein n=1 Tax=Nitrosomonas sp. JL21 TaxID=153949 RepID=UPI0013706CBF|nr:tetratricopeptide repeat protein [Nitrosomonas sp. JL21]MBL8498896.1 sel1 repeat family protein [Nitrosomonas sp.]MCC7092371.1 sel1 repeat family protein [Nitrosomonas sp.]MXS77865.1 sel1 repeat family protein [Nitrosomonas sp. JL21]
MNAYTAVLLAATLSLLTACGGESPSDKSEANHSSTAKGEITKMGEIPSLLSEGLTPEEQAELKDQILPSGVVDSKVAEEKFKKLLEDAKAGDPAAQNGLGVMYYTGEAISKSPSGQVLKNDPEMAAGWFFRAAEQGFADAQFNLGLMYVNGEGVEKNMKHAVELFKKAAEQGHIDAQNNLGAMYFTGEGVERDTKKAISWFEKAAAQGNADAKANLEAIKASEK